jgi:hypothetical protein
VLDHASIMSEIIPSLFVGCLPEPQVEVGCRSLDWRTKRSGTRKESPHHVMIDEPIERFDGDQAAIAEAKDRQRVLIDAAQIVHFTASLSAWLEQPSLTYSSTACGL